MTPIRSTLAILLLSLAAPLHAETVVVLPGARQYHKIFAAGEVPRDIEVNYWMRGGGGGGGAGYIPCAGCEVLRWGGGGGGSSAILLGTSRIAIAGGGGGGSGHAVLGSPGGHGVGASGGAGGGMTNFAAPVAATDVTGGIWNGVNPASAGGLGNAYVQAIPLASPCSSFTTYYGGPGRGGTNGGGGRYVFYSGSCSTSYGGGGGGGGGAGGGGGSGSYSTVDFTTAAGLAGGNGGALGVSGGNAPDLIASAFAQYGGFGGASAGAGGAGGNRTASLPSEQAATGVYLVSDPYLFLVDKGRGGVGDSPPFDSSQTSGTSGGVFLKYSASECIIKAPF